ncbi:MAG: 50S ribosomal protein L10 [Dehalococcoidia bacterium]|nr:50S ribosomal protein L10 [Dehalococcoidia bacterium]
MRRDEKKEAVRELAEKLERCNIAITTDYRGLSVAEMTELRRRLRQGEIEYRVIKNTLARFAAEQAGKEGLATIIEGPTAIAFGYGDTAAPAKALVDYIRSSKGALQIRGGLLDRRVLSASEVTTLATLPPRDELIAKLLAEMQGTIFSLVNVLNANITGFLGILNARIKQLGGRDG